MDPASAFKFEFYDVRHDWTQYADVAAQNPAKVREMHDLMFAEFNKYQVFPLDASVATRMVTPRPSMSAGRKVFNYSGEPVTGIPRGTAPSLLNTSYAITAEI
ncbi:MAG: arylsulfatase, partial [Oryzomonas sp.]